ncbi:hypothetical protein LCGC14_2825230 [marine sediment metagenome]|uniref:Uncharacterized protein n=1 Tax=marine sediment metagenome TaxID=412755 RepID=A0A0F8YFS8_9ZZZZ
MIIYIGFIKEQGKLLPEFVTDNLKLAKHKAVRAVDDALPNNSVHVFKVCLDVKVVPLIVASWTPEGEHVTEVPEP